MFAKRTLHEGQSRRTPCLYVEREHTNTAVSLKHAKKDNQNGTIHRHNKNVRNPTFVSDNLRNRQVIQKVGFNLGGGPDPQGRCLHSRCLHFPQEETTGLPPTPIPTNATKKASAMKLFTPPAATPNAPPINNVMLNAYLKEPSYVIMQY